MCAGIIPSVVRLSPRIMNKKISPTRLKLVYKLQEYIQRPNKKYAKKMMQIHKFPVATMNRDWLIEKLQTVERWKNVFEIQGRQVYLRNFSDVEHIIDLFTERYTKSEVTGQEYDTSVKNKAEPVRSENIAV